MKIVSISAVRLLSSLACLLCVGHAGAESVDVTTLHRQLVNADNGINPWWTPLQHYRGKTFLVLPDVDLRPMITEVDDKTGRVIVAPLDANPNYKAFPEGHQRFTLGIDPDGYLHVMGDMHGYNDGWNRYVERYNGQNILYWRSNKPLDVTGGFTFCGGEYSMSHLPGEEWGGDSRFFNDKNGGLYYGSRVRAFKGGNWPHSSEPFIAYGIYRYDNTTGIWTSLGGAPIKDAPGSSDYQKILYWEYTMGFESYHSEPRFDAHNRLHFSIGGNTANTEGEGLIYAVSDDFGKTWKKANGKVIPGLPIRGKDGEPDQGDLIERSKRVTGESQVLTDKNGKVALGMQGQWGFWDGSKWTPFQGAVGLLGPDGMLTSDGGDGFYRATAFGQPSTHFDTNFGSSLSVSELGLQDTGAIYSIFTPHGQNYTSAKEIWMGKAVFGPTTTICVGGTPSASSASDTAAQAFDGKQETKWSTDAAGPGWLEYALPANTKKAICRYELTSAVDSPQRDPKDWDLEGSDDGTLWITLDSRKNQLFEDRNQTKIYPVTSSTEYPYYRLNIKTARGGPSSGIQLAELKLLTVDASVAPAAPKIFFFQNDNGKVWLSWTQPDHAATYAVKRANAVGGQYVVIAKDLVDPADFCDTTGVKGNTYNYVVSAVNSAGESPNSDPVRITPQLMAPRPPLIQTAVGHNERVVLNWLPLWPDATNYSVKRSSKPGGPYTVIARGLPGLTYTDIKLTNDTPYYYVVSASNTISGESPNSHEIEGMPFRYVRLLRYQSLDHEDKGTVSASSENAPNEPATRAFDGEYHGKWLFPKSTAWLQYKFPDGVTPAVTRYEIIACGDAPERDPKDWEFQGSTDGTTWVTLDTQKDQSFAEQERVGTRLPRVADAPNQITPELNTYSFENPNGYQYYRLNITKTRDGGLGALSEVILWGDDTVLKTPPPIVPFPSEQPIATASQNQ
jgi:hypothetical protein